MNFVSEFLALIFSKYIDLKHHIFNKPSLTFRKVQYNNNLYSITLIIEIPLTCRKQFENSLNFQFSQFWSETPEFYTAAHTIRARKGSKLQKPAKNHETWACAAELAGHHANFHPLRKNSVRH